MWNKITKGSQLSKELLYIFLLDFGVALFTFFFLRLIASGLLILYCDDNNIVLSEIQEINYFSWIAALSILCATLIFIVLFLVLVGQKFAYLKDITEGIDALTAHRLNYQIPVKDNNEFTQLAKAINLMSQTELELKNTEEELAKAKENFIRSMSHDIRTPLTAIIAHTEYAKSKVEDKTISDINIDEIKDYLDMTLRKSIQIKELTDRLLDSSKSNKEQIDDGRLFLTQLAHEWMYSLEDNFDCKVNISEDIFFSGQYDVQGFIRIFDNLTSNIEKYADAEMDVSLNIYQVNNRLVIEQSNYVNKNLAQVESNKIGLSSIEQIARQYGGNIEINNTQEFFEIKITLFSI